MAAKPKQTANDDVSIAIWNPSGYILLVQRPADHPLWGGLWELPRASRDPDETLDECARRIAREQMGFTVKLAGPFGMVKHVVANRKITLHGFETEVLDTRAIALTDYAKFVWILPNSISEFAVASPQQRLLEQLIQRGGQGRLFFEDSECK